MKKSSSHILSLNAGSSSLKFALYNQESMELVLHGAIERIGMAHTFLSITDATHSEIIHHEVTSDPAQTLLSTLSELGFIDSLKAIGHRVVHGGNVYHSPTRITPDVLTQLNGMCAYAPQHLPIELSLIRTFINLLPKTLQVACFDTAFHHYMPFEAQMLPIPERYRADGVRRYGFHGLSCEYVLEALEKTHHVSIREKRIIIAHLGSGASLTAVRNGVSVDTTMGFTPNSGMPMGTRTGDIDAGLFEYFKKQHYMSTEAFSHMVTHESGLRAISGTTADMEVLLAEAPTNTKAEDAVAYFCYQVQKNIGALAAVMGGIDIVVFTGGIGERAPVIRSRICTPLEFLNITLDSEANTQNSERISGDNAKVTLYRIPTNEEYIIAKHTAILLQDYT